MANNLNNPTLPITQTPIVNPPPANIPSQTPVVNSSVGMPYAGFWVRYGAVFLDGLVLGVPIYATILILAILPIKLPAFIIQIIPGLVFLFADIYFITHFGATPGKMFFGLKVVGPDGSPPSMSKTILRESLGKFVSALILEIGYIWAAFDKEKQSLHDHIAGTHVILLKPVSTLKKVLIFLFFPAPLAILGILAAAVLIAINPAQRVKQAKDANIKSDIGAISSSLNAHISVHKVYPNSLNELLSSGELIQIPVGPDGQNYAYLVSPDGTGAAVYASLYAGNLGKSSVWCWQSSALQTRETLSAEQCKP